MPLAVALLWPRISPYAVYNPTATCLFHPNNGSAHFCVLCHAFPTRALLRSSNPRLALRIEIAQPYVPSPAMPDVSQDFSILLRFSLLFKRSTRLLCIFSSIFANRSRSSLAARLVLIASTRRCITSVSQLHTRWHKNALVARSPSPL
jgi:hypothetical protein